MSAEAKRNKLPWLEGYTVVKSNNMVIKIRNDDNVTCWVHRTQLRYVPDRPEHLINRKSTPLMIPVPVIPQIATKNPQPPIGGRQIRIGSSEKRRSKIPVMTEIGKNRQNSNIPASETAANNTTNVPKITQNVDGIVKNRRNSSKPASQTAANNTTDMPKTTQTLAKSSSRSLRSNGPTKSSVHPSQNPASRLQPQIVNSTRRYPDRIRGPPSKFKDYVKH